MSAAFLALFISFFSAYGAEISVLPGSAGQLILRQKSSQQSAVSMEGVQIVTENIPSFFSILPSSKLGPATIAAGQTHAFTLDYAISKDAPPGSFDITFRTVTQTASIHPFDRVVVVRFRVGKLPTHQAAADINYLQSTASPEGSSWQVQLAFDAYNLTGLDRVELTDAAGTVLSSKILSSTGPAVVHAQLPAVTFRQSASAHLNFLRIYDTNGATTTLNIDRLPDAAGSGIVAEPAPAGGQYLGELLDLRAPGFFTLGSQVENVTVADIDVAGKGGARLEGPIFTDKELYRVATILYEVGTGDQPESLSFQPVAQEDIFINRNFTPTRSRVSTSGPIPIGRFVRGRATIANASEAMPADVRCDPAHVCTPENSRYMYYPAGEFYISLVLASFVSKGVSLITNTNTPLGSSIMVEQNNQKVTFAQVTGLKASPNGSNSLGGGGMTRFEPISWEGATLDTVPQKIAFRLRTTAEVEGDADIVFNYASFLNDTITPTKLSGLSLIRLAGANVVSFSVDQEAKLLSGKIAANGTGELGVYALALPPDTVTPSPITDLQGLVQFPSSVNLLFTSVGDDGMEGRPEAYEVRILLAGQPYRQFERLAEADSGSPVQIAVPDLPPGRYTFSIRARDRAGNTSDSNPVSAVIPYILAAGPSVGSSQEAGLIAEQPADFEHLVAGDPRSQPFRMAAEQQGLLPLSSYYEVKTDGGVFNPPATLSIRYSDFGPLSQNSLTVYESHPNGGIFIPQQVHDKSNRIVRVTLPTVSSVFQLVGRVIDVMPPQTQVLFDGFSSATADGYLISTTSLVGFTAVDPPPSTGTASGVAQTLYLVDSVFVDTQTTPGTAYTAPFSLGLGTHTVGYYSVDNAGNYESFRQVDLIVEESTGAALGPDTTPPVTQVDFAGPFSTGPTAITITTFTSIILSAQDPPSPAGYATSGVNITGYRLNASSPVQYTSPFTLSPGSYAFSYFSEDNAGNVEPAQTLSLIVESGSEEPPPPPPEQGGTTMALARDGPGALWSVVNRNGSFTLEKFDTQPSRLASASLPGATDGADWSVSFDQNGNAYAVGSSSRPNEATDLALYKASPEGLLLSTAGYSTGADFNDFALDSSSDVWISGAVMDGLTGLIKLALWRYCPHTGELVKKAEYARGHGFDAAYGLSVHEGAVWAAGYSQNASGTFDLALWRFDSSGALTAPPSFISGQADEFHNHSKAAVSAGADGVFVAATRRLAGESDLSMLKFSHTGQLLSHRLWRGPAGRVERPSALVRRGAELAVAGLVDDAGAVWRYALDGTFLAAETSAGLAGISDAASLGAELWLGVQGSSVPVRFQNPAALSGEDVLVGGPADVTPPALTLSPASGSIVTTASPLLVAAYSDSGSGVDLASLELRLDGVLVSPSVFASSAVYSAALAQGSHSFAAAVKDLAGNLALAQNTFFLDSLPPLTTLLVNGAPPSSSIRPADLLSFSAADGGVGVQETRYVLNGAAESGFTAPFTLPEGDHVLSFHSVDQAGNLEAVRTQNLSVRPPAAGELALLQLVGGKDALQKPHDLALGEGGLIIAADTNADRLVLFGPDASPRSVYGLSGRKVEPHFNKPHAVDADAQGNLYVADTGHHRVVKLSPQGELLIEIGDVRQKKGVKQFHAGSGPGQLRRPKGLAVGADGRIYVADTGNRRVQVFGPDGAFASQFDLPETETAWLPYEEAEDEDADCEPARRKRGAPFGLAVDSAGKIYAADPKGRRVLRFEPDGSLSAVYQSAFARPEGVAVSADGGSV